MSFSSLWLFKSVLTVCLFWYFLHTGAKAQVTHPSEVTALREIKRNLDDSIQNNLTNWNEKDPCTSNWTGVLCSNITFDDGYLHVEELRLLKMKLSGSLSPEIGRFTYMKILNFMWNNISGSIPNEVGNMTSLQLLLLNGNHLTGSLPSEIGNLQNLDRIQIDQNQISGPIPSSFANLNKTKHFHMNNNSISGQIPPELSRLPRLVHFLLDNNNLSGYLPPELSNMPSLLILQLDNNNFGGSTIPESYVNMSKLLKLSLRNCNLQGQIPDLSTIPELGYLDLSSNMLTGSIPQGKLSVNMTTIDLSENNLNGTIPSTFSGLPMLQKLSLSNNSLSGSIPSTIWQNWTSTGNEALVLDFQNNLLSNISDSLSLPQNATIWLQGNPICTTNANVVQFCRRRTQGQDANDFGKSTNSSIICSNQTCPPLYELAPNSQGICFCAAPIIVQYRLKSPGFWDFLPYESTFQNYLTEGLGLYIYQLDIVDFFWEEGPRLQMELKFFPTFEDNNNNNNSNAFNDNAFNDSEVQRLENMFNRWNITDSDIFGPYEFLGMTLSDIYMKENPHSKTTLRSGALVGIILGTIASTVILSTIVVFLILRVYLKSHRRVSKRRQLSKLSIKIDGLREFTYGELELATNKFNSSIQIGQGGYGKVYKGMLANGTLVAIKRAEEGSLQGEKEFFTEIELLSRVHHRNLVSLIGYCDDQDEQMLVYEFMSNGTLRDHLSAKSINPLNFAMRLRIAIASSKGILYLHTEADPPIFHRDIKASNILLDSKFTAKVADFGLSKLAPVPEIDGNTPAHVSTVVKGTPGYLDPEYFLTHKLTDKSDVYSLGVVFFELLTGMHPIFDGKNIVREVNVAYQSGKAGTMIDKLMGPYPSECAERFMKLAIMCCQDETDSRPSMAEVVRELEQIWNTMPESDIKTHKSLNSDPSSTALSPPFTSSTSNKNEYFSSDISGNDLISGTIPLIAPR